jgi:hypothetical protein
VDVSATIASKSATCRASVPSPVSSAAATVTRRAISPASATSPRTGPVSSAVTASSLATVLVVAPTRMSSLLKAAGALLATGVLVEVIRVRLLLLLATGLTRAPLLPTANPGAMLPLPLRHGKASPHRLLSRRMRQPSVDFHKREWFAVELQKGGMGIGWDQAQRGFTRR